MIEFLLQKVDGTATDEPGCQVGQSRCTVPRHVHFPHLILAILASISSEDEVAAVAVDAAEGAAAISLEYTNESS